MSWECVSYWIEHHPGLASWVQAFGSIAAIVAAVYIMSRQHSRQEARDEAAIQSTYHKAAAVTSYVSAYLRETTELMKTDKSFHTIDRAKVMLDSMIIILSELSFHELEHPKAVMAWIAVRESAMEYRRTLELTDTVPPK